MIEMAMIDPNICVWSITQTSDMNCSIPYSHYICCASKCYSRNPENVCRRKTRGVNQVNSISWRIIDDDCIIDCSLPRRRRTEDLSIALKCDALRNI